jgi:serine/threonine-protein kinase
VKKIGRYDIVSVCGKGAMGLVYKAHDPNIDRTVAIKTVLVQHLSGEQATEYESRFRSEARAAGKLQHPNIVGVYDAGREAGMAYIVMEFIDGEDLSQARNRGEKFTMERTLGLVTNLVNELKIGRPGGDAEDSGTDLGVAGFLWMTFP